MESAEETMQILERYTRLKQKDIPKELEEYLGYVAKTGDTVFKWSSLKYLFREKFLNVIKHFHDTSPCLDEITQCPNVDPFNYENMKSSLLERLELFNSAPFTIQRLCELLIDPRKQYSRIDKFMRALEKNILVVSTVEPGRKCVESENGDSLDSVVNGDLSLDVNVDIDMETESLFSMETQNVGGTSIEIDINNKAEYQSNLIDEYGKSKQNQNNDLCSLQTPMGTSNKNEDSTSPLAKKAKLEFLKSDENSNENNETKSIDRKFEEYKKIELKTILITDENKKNNKNKSREVNNTVDCVRIITEDTNISFKNREEERHAENIIKESVETVDTIINVNELEVDIIRHNNNNEMETLNNKTSKIVENIEKTQISIRQNENNAETEENEIILSDNANAVVRQEEENDNSPLNGRREVESEIENNINIHETKNIIDKCKILVDDNKIGKLSMNKIDNGNKDYYLDVISGNNETIIQEKNRNAEENTQFKINFKKDLNLTTDDISTRKTEYDTLNDNKEYLKDNENSSLCTLKILANMRVEGSSVKDEIVLHKEVNKMPTTSTLTSFVTPSATISTNAIEAGESKVSEVVVTKKQVLKMIEEVEDIPIEEPPAIEEIIMAEPSSSQLSISTLPIIQCLSPTAMATEDEVIIANKFNSLDEESSGMEVDDTSQEAMDQ